MAATVGTRIKRARERKRWTQRQLADALQVNIKTVDNWENGRTSPKNSIGALEEVLGVRLDDEPEPEPELPPSLLDDICRTFPDEEDRQRAIRLFRRTLSEGIAVPPSAGEPPERGRRAGL